MGKYRFTDCVDIVGNVCKPFEGSKKYISTGAVEIDHIVESDIAIVEFKSKPSRANLTAESGDILFAKMIGTKKTLLLDDITAQNVYSTGFCAVRAKEDILSPCCLYHLLSSTAFLEQKDRNCSGATQKAITNAGLDNIIISLPKVDEQDVITHQLNKIVAIIHMRQKEIQKLDDLIKSRFVEVFGDVIRNSKGWRMCTFSEIASSRLGKMLDTKQQTGENNYPYLANFNVQWFRFNLENLNQMDFDKGDRAEFELRDGDLLVCEGGEIGRCAVWHNELQPCFFQKALHRVRCDRQVINPDYLAGWFRYNCDHEGFAAIAGAKATIAHLPGVKLKQLRVAVPPMELQDQFAAFVHQVDKSKAAVQKSLDKLQTLFDKLMQEYFG